MAEWTFNGHAPETLGIETFTLTKRNMGADVLTMKFNRSLSDPLWVDYGTPLTVGRNGIVWFSGTVLTAPRWSSDRGEGLSIKAMGPWWQLERSQYYLTFPFNAPASALNTGGRVALFVNPATNAEESTAHTLARILQNASVRGLVSSGVPAALYGTAAPPEKSVDRSLASAIHGVMRYHLNWGAWISGAKNLRWARRGGSRFWFEIGNSAVTEVSPTIRRDINPSGIILRYEREGSPQDKAGYRAAIFIDQYPMSAYPNQPGVIMETITLRKGETIPGGGLAFQMYQSLRSNPIVEGSMTLMDEDCATGLHPAATVNLYGMGIPTAWATMEAVISEMSETPYEGKTEVTFGLPPAMGVREQVDLHRFRNRFRTRDELAARDNRVEEVPEGQMTPYLVRRDVDGLWVVRVSPGEVSVGNDNGIVSGSPFFGESSIRLDQLNGNGTPPEFIFGRGADFNVWLYVDLEPKAVQGLLEDGDGNPVSEWVAVGNANLLDVRIRFAATDARPPDVSPITGIVTSGHLYWKLARVTWRLVDPAPTIAVVRTGNFQLLFTPPDRVYVLPETSGD